MTPLVVKGQGWSRQAGQGSQLRLTGDNATLRRLLAGAWRFENRDFTPTNRYPKVVT